MAPTRVTRAGIKASALPKLTNLPTFGGSKRAAERSPPKKQPNKRAALGDVTNKTIDTSAFGKTDLKKTFADRNPLKKIKKARKAAKETTNVVLPQQDLGGFSSQSQSQSSSSSSSQNSSQESSSAASLSRTESDQSELSLLLSSQDGSVPESERGSVNEDGDSRKRKAGAADDGTKEDVFHDAVETLSPNRSGKDDADDSVLLLSVDSSVAKKNERNQVNNTEIPRVHIEDIDKENKRDPYLVPDYAQDIFTYYKEREPKFSVSDYMKTQTDISLSMRAIVVDWMVEVQENFELNHETLYMAIRLVDLYLTKQKVSRDKLQLVAATALFISCKFDERVPPVLDDFLYVCDDAYKREEYIKMEMQILKEIGFDIGMPSSYRFLRRYAKCGKIGLDTLTLSRYLLETSQMEYDYLMYQDSQLAAACLLLAMKMKKIGDWTATLAYYSTYQANELVPLMSKLNKMISLPPYKNLQTIKTKYSHKVFFEVAKTPALDPSVLASMV